MEGDSENSPSSPASAGPSKAGHSLDSEDNSGRLNVAASTAPVAMRPLFSFDSPYHIQVILPGRIENAIDREDMPKITRRYSHPYVEAQYIVGLCLDHAYKAFGQYFRTPSGRASWEGVFRLSPWHYFYIGGSTENLREHLKKFLALDKLVFNVLDDFGQNVRIRTRDAPVLGLQGFSLIELSNETAKVKHYVEQIMLERTLNS